MKHQIVILAFLLVSGSVWADGKLYSLERVPPEIPYQRALILFQDGKETLVLQSKFETSQASSTNSVLGWVVPVPSLSDLASMEAQAAWGLFFRLGSAAKPKVTHVGNGFAVFLLVLLIASVASFLLCLLSFLVPRPSAWAKRRARLARFAFCGLVTFVFVAPMASFARKRGESGVDVIRSEQVGIYEAKVIKSDSSSDLIAWLNENGFHFTPTDAPVLDQYIGRGWCFVVAKVRPVEMSSLGAAHDGLIDPLILRFETASPVYPLALTSTIGSNTEVLIYLLSDRKMACGERMKLMFAGDFDADGYLGGFLHPDLTEVFQPWETKLSYLCKFKGVLTPGQMRTDLTFTPAQDNATYRERIVKW